MLSAMRPLDHPDMDFLVRVATESPLVVRGIKRSVYELEHVGVRWIDPCGHYTRAELELVLAHLAVQGVPT